MSVIRITHRSSGILLGIKTCVLVLVFAWVMPVLTIVWVLQLYIHVVSAVVDLPPQLTDFLTLPNYGENANVKTLTAIVKATPNITQLTTAQDITVFLPSDSAFAAAVAKYGPSALSNLTEVTNVLKDHVIQGHAIFTGANQTSYTTAAGNALTVGLGGTSSVTGTVVFFPGFNVANIVEPNIILQNGVAHVRSAFFEWS